MLVSFAAILFSTVPSPTFLTSSEWKYASDDWLMTWWGFARTTVKHDRPFRYFCIRTCMSKRSQIKLAKTRRQTKLRLLEQKPTERSKNKQYDGCSIVGSNNNRCTNCCGCGTRCLCSWACRVGTRGTWRNQLLGIWRCVPRLSRLDQVSFKPRIENKHVHRDARSGSKEQN